MMERGVIVLVKAYQKAVAPILPAFIGGGCGCRFYPSCSEYAVEALQAHGVLAGGYLAVKRVLKCQPFHPGGVDLVPGRAGARKPRRLPLHNPSDEVGQVGGGFSLSLTSDFRAPQSGEAAASP